MTAATSDWPWTTTQPWRHQREAFEFSKDRAAAALFCEQRTGKSLTVIATAAYLYAAKKIDALVVFAPAGVHRNWVTDELPKHAAPFLDYRALAWQSTKSSLVWYKKELEALLAHPGLAVLTVNYDVLQGQRNGIKYLTRFLRARKILAVADESTALKTWAAKQTKGAVNFARRCPYRRILTGTPVTEGPLGLFGQCQFLGADLLGYTSYTLFKARYAAREDGYNPHTGQTFKKQKVDDQGRKVYLHLDELQARVARFSYQVTRAQCADLPPLQVVPRPFELTGAQRKVYDDLREEYRAEINGTPVTAANILTRYLRLQQVASNYWPAARTAVVCAACAGEGCGVCSDLGVAEVDEPLTRIGETNPRLNALSAEAEQLPPGEQAIVWTRFRQDVDDVLQELKRLGKTAVRYDGQVSADERAANRDLFKAGGSQFFVANQMTKGAIFGQDFSNAHTLFYYSHHFSLERWLQSIDRVETLARTWSLAAVVFTAVDTVDELILAAHAEKRRLSDVVLGRHPKELF